jgi:putative endopeptidase
LCLAGVSDEDLDEAFIYGHTFIGHEISHGFDNYGKDYDAYGNRVNWWTTQDSIEYMKRAKLLIDEFSAFTPVDTLHVDGARTLFENIADLVGLRITLDAFKKTKQYKENKKINGFTPLQRFFLAYAYRQMGHATKESLINQIMQDNHAPDRERVNGVLMNIPEFYEAFQIKPGDRMYQPENLRVQIW